MRILFICTGNMTRSPLAECVLREKLEAAGLKGIEVISAGTGATEGLDRQNREEQRYYFSSSERMYKLQPSSKYSCSSQGHTSFCSPSFSIMTLLGCLFSRKSSSSWEYISHSL